MNLKAPVFEPGSGAGHPPADAWHALHMGDARALAQGWAALRADLHSLWDAYTAALPANLEIRYSTELNPPRWEFGHIAWFEEHWIARNPQRRLGTRADPDVPRAASVVHQADALYNSSRVAHTRRWHLDLPDARATRRDAGRIHERSLALLAASEDSDDALYMFRLSALHEAMHREAWIYMAQNLAIDLRGTGLPLQPAAVAASLPAGASAVAELALPAQRHTLGTRRDGFVFDNEVASAVVDVADVRIDAAPVTWARFMPFVEAGGYEQREHWSDEGWAWRRRHSPGHPRYLHRGDAHAPWQRAVFGRWEDLPPDAPAVNLNAHEAQAWCRWAGRRLPSEAEWECAALTHGDRFAWGEVWEWTSSPFTPFDGFEAHPYRDYSQPWFDGRPVLRGASFATWPGLRDLRYRNYFTAERNDLFAGFRSCAA